MKTLSNNIYVSKTNELVYKKDDRVSDLEFNSIIDLILDDYFYSDTDLIITAKERN